MRSLFTSIMVICAILLCPSIVLAQEEFFRSKQQYKEDELEKLYASIALHDSLLIFNAPDYRLYAYNKNDLSLKWTAHTYYKTSVPVFVSGNAVYAGYYTRQTERAAIFDLATGVLVKELPFGPLATKPLIRNGMLYGTCIYNFGCIIGYNIALDSVMWSHFIAHGYSTQPVFTDSKIIANAEGNNWFDIGYDGALLDTSCTGNANNFVESIPCVKKYIALTHDGRELKGKQAAEILEDDSFGVPAILTTDKLSFIFYDGKLTVLGDKLKKKQQVDLAGLVPDNGNYNSMGKMLKADNEFIWLMYRGRLVQYDHKTDEVVKSTDFNNWQPHTVILDQDRVWLISGTDGLLYGFRL